MSQWIDTSEITLDAWLALLQSRPAEGEVQDWQFPNESVREEFFRRADEFSDEQVKALLRLFLIPSGTLGCDESHLEFLRLTGRSDPDRLRYLMGFEHNRRLFSWLKSRGKTAPPWEGITWVLDLLPHFPREALAALNAYFLAHAQLLPDGRVYGLGDAIDIVRARWIGTPDRQASGVSTLYTLSPREFECLVERLYAKMGYDVVLTPPSKDGGRDVIASRAKKGRRESLRVECKLHTAAIGVVTVRAMLGVVSDEKVGKGVIVAAGQFTKAARDLAERNPRLELINGHELVVLFNEYLGPRWPASIDRLVRDSLRAAGAVPGMVE